MTDDRTRRPRDDAAAPSFSEVYAAQHAPIVRLSFLLVRSQAVAEELAQDACLRPPF